MAFASNFGRILSPTFQPNSQAMLGGWWLAGGIPASNCIAAYQSKGAASYTASKVNLANPGKYDAAEGTAPDWDATNGWTFDGSTQYLTTGITPVNNQTWSFISRYSDTTNQGGFTIGSFNERYVGIQPVRSDNTVGYWSGGPACVAPSLTAGILCVAGSKGYRNGSFDGNIEFQSGLFAALNIGRASLTYQYAGKIQAIAIYNATLTTSQISALTTAMNDL